MSLPNFLNPSSPTSTKPPSATVIRHITKKIDIQPVSRKIVKSEPITVVPEIQIPKAPIIIHHPDPVLKSDDILTFVILANILLSKKQAQSLSSIFIKLICGKMQHQILSVKVSQIIHTNSDVYKAWQVLFDRSKNEDVLEESIITVGKPIIKWFLSEYSMDVVLKFFDFIIRTSEEQGQWIHIFSTILKLQLNNKNAKNVAELMGLAKEFMVLTVNRKKKRKPVFMTPLNFQEFIGIDEPKNPFDLAAKVASAAKLKTTQKSLPVPQKINLSTLKRFTPSHLRYESPVSENHNPFLFNEMTKSHAVSVETYGRYRPPDIPSSVMVQDLYQVMENIEVNENKVDRIFAFSECNPFAGYCMRFAGREAFSSNWNEIEPHIENPIVRDIVINRCRSQLGDLEEEHEEVLKAAQVVMLTRPTNAFIYSIRALNVPKCFSFPLIPSNVSSFLLHFLQMNYNSKISPIQYFFTNVIPFIQQEKNIYFIHSRTYASLLWHFSILCQEIGPLLNATPLEINSYEAVLDMAAGKSQGQGSFGSDYNSHKSLGEILKSIIQNRIITDEMAIESTKHFGALVEHITHFYPLVERMSIASNFLRSDIHMKKLTQLSQILGIFNDEIPTIVIESRKNIYKASISDIKLHSLYSISTDIKNGKITLAPYPNY